MRKTKSQYLAAVEARSPGSPTLRNTILAFLVGGAICTVGQGILDGYKYFGLSADEAAIATAITLVFLGAMFTGLKVYDNLAKYAGAGTIVPITGFANAIVSPAMEFKSEGFVLGMGAKMFTIAGPVIVFGTVASVVYGVILVLIGRG